MKRIDYAPGPYVSFCVDCDAEFMGHELAVRCERCGAGKYDTISIVDGVCISCEHEHSVRIIETAAWRCGHPRSAENTKVVRSGTGTTCKQCFREHNRIYIRNKRAALAGEAAPAVKTPKSGLVHEHATAQPERPTVPAILPNKERP